MKLQKQTRPDEAFTIEFRDQTIDAYRKGNDIFVNIKTICRNLGLDTTAQLKKVKQNPVLKRWRRSLAIPSKGGVQETTMINLEGLNFWLATFNASRVKKERRGRLIRYQVECANVLFRHFSNTKTQEQSTDLLKNEKFIKVMDGMLTFLNKNSERLDRIEQLLEKPPKKKKRRSQSKSQQELFDTPRKKLVKKMRAVARNEDPREAWLKLYAETKKKIGVDLIALSKGNYRPLDVAEDFEIIPNMIMIADLLWRE